MPRLSLKDVNDREKFVRDLFNANPDLPMPQANKKIFEKFGSKMRPQRVYELRRLVREEKGGRSNTSKKETEMKKSSKKVSKQPSKVPSKTASKNGVTTAARPGNIVPPNGGHSNVRLVEVQQGSEAAVADALNKLKKAGAFNGHVEYKGGGYLVVVMS